MEVDSELGSGRSSPSINYLSSPRLSRSCFFSAPSTPSRMSHSPPSAIPFHWELAPGTPKSHLNDFEFAFHVSVTHNNSASADDLFHAGKIRPLKPPPRLDAILCSPIGNQFKDEQHRRRGGRNWRHRVARSLSPFQQREEQTVKPSASFSCSTKGFSKKWSFKNFLLFRSTSQESAEFTDLSKKQEEVKNSSFRSAHSSDSTRKTTVSAHTPNKTSSQDLKRKSSLPYKQGVLGRLAFGSMLHALGNRSASFGR